MKASTETGFASTNLVCGFGSYGYQAITRDTFGFAIKCTYGVVDGEARNIYKDPITDDGSKRSLRGLLAVHNYTLRETKDGITVKTYKGETRPFTKEDLQEKFLKYPENIPYYVKQECTPEEESQGLLQTIYEDGKFYNQTTLSEIRERINKN